jgi:hypothetical protein
VQILAPDVAVFADANTQAGNVVDIANAVNVFEGVSTTAFGVVANAGSGGTVILKSTSDTGNVWSMGPVTLESGVVGDLTTVHGSARGHVAVTVPVNATVTPGPNLQNQNITLGRTDVTATFPQPPPADIFFDDPTGTLTLPQGAYGNVTINQGTLSLSTVPGTYTFESLTLESGTTFLCSNNTAVVRVSIRGTFIFRAAMNTATNPANLRFAVFGAGGATLMTGTTTSMFRGTVVAMNGALLVQDTRTYRGAFFGRTVTLGSGVTIQHIQFSAWEAPSV